MIIIKGFMILLLLSGPAALASAECQERSVVRLTSKNVEEVARREDRLDLEDGHFHSIVWTRYQDGIIQVHVDDRRLTRVKVQEQESLAELPTLFMGAGMHRIRYLF